MSNNISERIFKPDYPRDFYEEILTEDEVQEVLCA
jgi:hypothetical protein